MSVVAQAPLLSGIVLLSCPKLGILLQQLEALSIILVTAPAFVHLLICHFLVKLF